MPQNLEKDPLAEVAPEPYELLDRQRFLRSCRDLGEESEAQLAHVVGSMAQVGLMLPALRVLD